MIPISEKTSLSADKTAKLIQILVDLKNRNVELPKQILESINSPTLVNDIDTFLRTNSTYENSNEVEFVTVKAIVESYPEFLATEFLGALPIHCAARFAHVSKKYLKLYVDIGLEHEIGGKHNRGGLLVSDEGCPSPLFMIEDPEKLAQGHSVGSPTN